MNTRSSAGIWGFIIVLTVVSAGLGWMRLAGLPDLGVLVGPDLTVRSVAMDRGPATDAQHFQRGDKLTAIGASNLWMTVGDLGELRQVLPMLVDQAESLDDQGSEAEAEASGDEVILEYQLFRPVHRFSLALQGEQVDPTALPPGVEPRDRLVEIDGRLLPGGGHGAEGIRSVASSRPDAVFGIERPETFFFGQMKVASTSSYPGVILAFLLALVGIFVLWRWHSEAAGELAAWCIALETLALGWLFFLVFGFQWVLADSALAAGVIIALVMIRPLAIFAREQARTDEATGGLIAIGIGALASVTLIVMMMAGYLPSPEEALHAAAMVTGLFIIYELSASSIEGDSMLSLGERGGYLAGIVALGLFACLVAAVMQPVAFEEDRWRWFAVLLPSLVWFGDMLYGVRHGARSAMGEVADRGSRHKLVRRYLSEMALEMPHTDLRIVAKIDGAAMELRPGKKDLEVRPASSALADAVEILITENARIPLPEGVERQSHPMAGIAKAMNISIAVPLTPPPGSLTLDSNRVDTALVGMRRSAGGDIPSYASSETLDRAQELWKGSLASAAVIEAVSGLFKAGMMSGDGQGASPTSTRELKEAREEIAKCQEEKAVVVDKCARIQQELDETEQRSQIFRLGVRPVYPDVEIAQSLLEPELIEGLEYLLQDGVPIVFGGPVGAGKGFVAYVAHCLDGGSRKDFVMVDTSEPDASETLDIILGDTGGGTGSGLLDSFDGGLFVRGAQRCDDGRILALCHQCEEKGIRLYLGFESEDIEQKSVLDDRPETLQELLGHREVIIPRFRNRSAIIAAILEFWLAEWSVRYGKRIEAFSRMAAEALEAYEYPGQISEAVEIVRLAVVDAEHDVVDRENLPLRVREALPL